ncbi:hypothetical protein DERF_016709 [Dermatophagoides farinae]|uniref:Uncharacterized protein n=1 Tax=Dermatophagoides farinae TaxID=6954 RepID=A0A922HK79_DERFA|nr:hypothetical protein DERF_016709 [Dermatophagoides farinae]
MDDIKIRKSQKNLPSSKSEFETGQLNDHYEDDELRNRKYIPSSNINNQNEWIND